MNLCDCNEGHVCLVHELEAESATLREEVKRLTEERDDAEAACILETVRADEASALLSDALNPDGVYGWMARARAFLRRDEARRCSYCPSTGQCFDCAREGVGQ